MRENERLLNIFVPMLVLGMVIVSCTADSVKDALGMGSKPAADMVSMAEAQEDLQKILDDIEVQTTRAGVSAPHKEIGSKFSVGEPKTRATDDDTPYYHVFNFKDNKGYAIMSGSKRMPSLVALTDSGSYSKLEEVTNPGLRLFMEKYTENYENLLNDDEDTTVYETVVYGEYKNVVYNYRGNCQVKWGQDSPFNQYCPLLNGERTVTGCNATAVSQLLSIYRYPYTLDGYSFTWYDMLEESLATLCTEEAQQQIARLMERIGSHLGTNYGVDISTASPSKIPAFLEKIGFSSGGSYNVAFQQSTASNELKKGYSLIFYGFTSAEKKNGHTWLCHGLMERYRPVYTYYMDKLVSTMEERSYYFLFNWGYSGDSDGYYLSNVFDYGAGPAFPESTRSGSTRSSLDFSTNVRMITGIRR